MIKQENVDKACGTQVGPKEWELLFAELGSLDLSGQQLGLAGCADLRARRVTTPVPPPAQRAGMFKTSVHSSVHPFISPAGRSHTPPMAQASGASRKENMQQYQLT